MFKTTTTIQTSSGPADVSGTFLDSGDSRLELTFGEPATRMTLEIPEELLLNVHSTVKALMNASRRRIAYEAGHEVFDEEDFDDDLDDDDDFDE